MLAALLAAWRSAWRTRDLPFLFVQYPKGGGLRGAGTPPSPPEEPERPAFGLHSRGHWAKTLALPHTGIAESFDLEGGVHPADKESYGERLAAVALAQVYGRDVADSGPSLSKTPPRRARTCA